MDLGIACEHVLQLFTSGNPQMHQLTALDIAMDWTLSINMLPLVHPFFQSL